MSTKCPHLSHPASLRYAGQAPFFPRFAGEDVNGSFSIRAIDLPLKKASSIKYRAPEEKGKAAELLFDGMRAKAVQEEACTGGMVKAGGNGLYCNKDADGAFCEFGYSFSEKAFTGSSADC